MIEERLYDLYLDSFLKETINPASIGLVLEEGNYKIRTKKY